MNTVKIEPSLIPAEEYQTACAILASSIRLALSDPAKRKEYEEWKQRRRSNAEATAARQTV